MRFIRHLSHPDVTHWHSILYIVTDGKASTATSVTTLLWQGGVTVARNHPSHLNSLPVSALHPNVTGDGWFSLFKFRFSGTKGYRVHLLTSVRYKNNPFMKWNNLYSFVSQIVCWYLSFRAPTRNPVWTAKFFLCFFTGFRVGARNDRYQ